MTAEVQSIPPERLPGMEFHPRLGLHVQNMVARQLVTHTTIARPTRHFPTCTFDTMAGNTMLGMHLADVEVGSYKCDHRHFDETASFILTGRGFSEYRQADEGEKLRVDWEAGDLLVIPSNAWHRHVNTSDVRVRQISFRSTPLMTAFVFGGDGNYEKSDAIYHQSARFTDRFDDQPDYFTSRQELAPGRVGMNFVSQVASQALPEDNPEYGSGVAIQAIAMGGQRITDLAVARIRAGGNMRGHRPLAEESFLVMQGSGASEVWTDDGPRVTLQWSAGDLVSAPLGAWREHTADAGEDVRILMARCTAFERALGIADQTAPWRLDSDLPDRLEALVDAGIAGVASR